MSNGIYNKGTHMIAGSPITSKEVKYIPALKLNNLKVKGYIVLQILGYDYLASNGEFIDHLDEITLRKADSALNDIFGV